MPPRIVAINASSGLAIIFQIELPGSYFTFSVAPVATHTYQHRLMIFARGLLPVHSEACEIFCAYSHIHTSPKSGQREQMSYLQGLYLFPVHSMFLT